MKTKAKEIARAYEKSVRWSEEDGCYVGSVEVLVGDCCHGDDPVKVFQECEEIALECVEAALESGKELPPAQVSVVMEDAVEIRKSSGLSQVKFAETLGISAKTLHKWEQGTSSPSGAAKSLLKLYAAEPKTVRRVLA